MRQYDSFCFFTMELIAITREVSTSVNNCQLSFHARELIDVAGNSADVKLTGMCAGCPSAHMTLYLGVESALRVELPEFETLRLI